LRSDTGVITKYVASVIIDFYWEALEMEGAFTTNTITQNSQAD